MRVWSAAELRQFLLQVCDDRLFALWRLAATTRMRRGELLGLRWQNVDLNPRRVAVRQTLTTVNHHVVFGEPKSARSKRSIALDADTVAALRRWRIRQSEERLEWGAAWSDTGLVFTGENGVLVHPDTMSFWFERQVRSAGVPPIRFHWPIGSRAAPGGISGTSRSFALSGPVTRRSRGARWSRLDTCAPIETACACRCSGCVPSWLRCERSTASRTHSRTSNRGSTRVAVSSSNCRRPAICRLSCVWCSRSTMVRRS